MRRSHCRWQKARAVVPVRSAATAADPVPRRRVAELLSLQAAQDRAQRKKDLGQCEEGNQQAHGRLAMAQAQRLQRRGHAGACETGGEKELGQHQPGQLDALALEPGSQGLRHQMERS